MRISPLLLGLLFVGCTFTPATTMRGQMITCGTDPTTGVILSCDPGTGSGSGSGTVCHDIDEDGDGDPHDQGEDHHDSLAPDDHMTSDDDDGDGIKNEDDCDEHPGEDDDHHSS